MRSGRAILLLLIVITIACVIPYRWLGVARGPQFEMAVWGMPFEDRLFRDIYARGFEAQIEGLSIRYDRYDELVADKYLAWHVVGEGPDVMRLPITNYHMFVERGLLADLSGFIEDQTFGLSGEERADYTPAIWKLLNVEGSYYALPQDNAQFGLYYNRAVFDRYNTEHPGARLEYPSADWTWEDLRAAASKLTIEDEQGAASQYGIDFTLWSWPFMTFHAQAGGELWDAQQSTTLINSPAGLEALALIVDLLPHSAAMRSLSTVGSASGPDKLFAGGQTAMMLDGSWRAPDLERVNPNLDFAIAPLPHHHEKAVVSGAVLWAVSAHSQNKELAWRMIKWMTSHEQSLAYWHLLRVAPPARVSVMQSNAFRSTPGLIDEAGRVWVPPMSADDFDDKAAWLLDAITPDASGNTPGFVPVAPYQKDLEDAIDAMLKRAVAPGRTESLQSLLDAAADSVHEIIDRDRSAHGLPPIERN